MAAVVENKQPEQWTITEQLTTRENARTRWERDFNANMNTVADKISESITNEVFEKLRQHLSDPYKPLPTSSNPMKVDYSLGLKRNAHEIKKWAGDEANRPPFREWFDAFGTASNNRKRGQDFDDTDSSVSFISINNEEIEIGYFQDLMAKIGHRIEEAVRRNMRAFAENPQNAGIASKVEWYRKAEKYVSNPSVSNDNSLYVSVWIAPNQVNRPAEIEAVLCPQENRPAASWCILL